MDLSAIMCVLLALICGVLGCLVYTTYQASKKRNELIRKGITMIIKAFKK